MQNITVLYEIEKRENENPFDLSLKLKSFSPAERRFIAEQIECRAKAIKKLPFFYSKKCIYTKRALEQSSSEEVAKFKTKLIKGETLIDLCGGFGVDDYWLSQCFKTVTSYDENTELNEIVRHNNTLLNYTNHERINGSAEDINFDDLDANTVIYLDPDRRDSHGKKQFLPENHSPNIYPILEKIDGRLKVYIKLSPMIDISLLLKNIPSITGLWVISHKLENKEILLECNGDSQKGIWAIELNAETLQLKQDLDAASTEFNFDKKFLFIPSPAILKSKNGETIAHKHNLSKINSSFQFLFGDERIPSFMGRFYKVIKKLAYKPKTIKKDLKELHINKAEIFSRNFFHSSEDLSKILRIPKGGDHFLAFTIDKEKNPWVFICALKSQNPQA